METIVRLEALLRQVVDRLQLPTRYCVLSDIVKQARARERGPVDVGFQSLAGSSTALRGMVGLDVDGVLDLARGFSGCYFETGQGSAVTNGAAEGVDMVTLEARAYGVARYLRRETGRVDDRQRRRRLHRTGSVPDQRATAARVSGRRRHGEAARPDHGPRRVRDLSHGHRACRPAARDAGDRRAGRAGVSDGGGRQRGPDARISDDVLPRASAPSRRSPAAA